MLATLAEQARLEPRCIRFRLYQGEVRVVVLEKLWGNEEALARHLQSEDYRKVLVVVSSEAILTEHLQREYWRSVLPENPQT